MSVAPREPEFWFKIDSESAGKNFHFLSNHDSDLSKPLLAQKGSPLKYVSEFKPVGTLKPLFEHQQHWHRTEQILKEGPEWPMEELGPNDRILDLKKPNRWKSQESQ